MTFISQVEYRGSDDDVALFNVQVTQTSKAVAIPFQDQFNVIGGIFGQTDASTLDGGDATNVKNALEAMLRLAKNGVEDPDDTHERTFYLSQGMGEGLSLLLDTFRTVGAGVDLDTLTVTIDADQLKAWHNLSRSSNAILEILRLIDDGIFGELKGYFGGQTKINGVETGQELALDSPFRVYSSSLQAFTELIYVRTGNEVFSDKLDELEEALTTTKDVLAFLADAQFLHNQVTTFEKAGNSALQDASVASEEGFVRSYQDLANARYLDSRIIPVPTSALLSGVATSLNSGGRTSGLTRALAEFFRIKTGLSEAKRTLAILTFSGNSMPDPSSIDESTLFAKVSKMLSNFDTTLEFAAKIKAGSFPLGGIDVTLADGTVWNTTAQNFATSTIALYLWLMDEQGDTTPIPGLDEGGIQRNLAVATTAAQNLNDTQKEEVRRFLLVFEEYYKSASAILNKITQIIEKIAQGISR